MIEHIVASFAAILVASIFCQWIAWRVKLPAILFLLLVGILAGPVWGVLEPDRLLGDLLFPFVSLSVAVILFEGSLTLRYREIVGTEAVVRNLVSFGLAITWIVTTAATRYALGFSWQICFLFGAITVVTGPTVIVPMLRTVRPTAAVANILRWEGIMIDPIGASLAVLVYEFIIAGGGQGALGHTLLTFGRIVAAGAIVGALGGYLFGLVLRNHWLPEFLHDVSALALVFGVYAASNLLRPESGLVTVTVMGVWLANMEGVDVEGILDFKESLSILLISLLFVLLAARLDFASFRELGWPAVLVFLAIQFLARPLNVTVSTLRSKLTWPERHLLAWIAPRGIVAAAVSALFAIQLQKAGVSGARVLEPLTFLVIIGTVLLQSATARPLARWLGVAEPEPKGFLIIGANLVARAVARALVQSGFRVLLADTEWDDIVKARMEGLPTYYGNAISEHADRHLDLIGIGAMMALTPYENRNLASVMHYRMELGPNNAYVLQSRPADGMSQRLQVSPRRRGRTLFGSGVTYASLADRLSAGGKIRTTKLTEAFGLKDLLKLQGEGTVLLFAFDPRERIQVFSAERSPTPGPGWSVMSLISEPDGGGKAAAQKRGS